MRTAQYGGEAILSVLLLSCAASGRAASQPTRVALEPCPIHDPAPVDSTWHQVRASGFTFCVPGTWRQRYPTGDSVERRVWAAGADFITWGIGQPPSEAPDMRVRTVTGVIVTVGPEGGRVFESSGVPVPSSLPIESACMPATRTPFMIGSVVLVVTRVSCEGAWSVTGRSTDPAIYMLGDSRSAQGAAQLVAAMLTLRLTARRP